MKRIFNFALASFALMALFAHASDHQKVTLGGAYTQFTGDYGSRDIVNAEYASVLGANTYVVNIAKGGRDYDNSYNDSFNGHSASGTFYRNWNPLFSTRSSLTASSNSPVFVRRVIDQDVTYKGIADTTFTVGAKHSEYYRGVTSNVWSLGGAYYTPRVTTGYRYSHYDISGIGHSYGMSLMVQLKDRQGAGQNQLWLGKGTSIQEYIWSPSAMRGDFKSLALRRVQPLGSGFSLGVTVEKAWYATPVADYEGLTGQLGLSYQW